MGEAIFLLKAGYRPLISLVGSNALFHTRLGPIDIQDLSILLSGGFIFAPDHVVRSGWMVKRYELTDAHDGIGFASFCRARPF